MMKNGSYRNEILRIEGLRITGDSAYPVFVLLLLIYLFIMMSNLGIIMIITMDKALHKPMYFLFCNLPVCDVLNVTVVLPQLLQDLLVESDRYISYTACVIQAFVVHTFNTCAHTILMVMAFDRYVAICDPLRYHNIMTNQMVVQLSVIAWVSATGLIMIIFAPTLRLSHCTSTISNIICDNPSLFKLSCDSLLLNQIIGLFVSVIFWILSVSCISLTYIKIADICLKSKNSTMKSKAIQTCSTHLIVYLIHFTSGWAVIILHRFSAHHVLRNLASLITVIIPTSLNPVIYGLQTKEIRQRFGQMLLRRKVIPG